MLITKPMLAASCEAPIFSGIFEPTNDVLKLKFPLIATPKVDGIRALKPDGRLVSRKFLAIPNDHIRQTLEAILPDGADGEIVVGKTFQAVSSGVMSEDGKPDFVYWIFDLVTSSLDKPYDGRLKDLINWWFLKKPPDCVRVLPFEHVNSLDELAAYVVKCQKNGWDEGVMVRSPSGPYKCGRATLNSGWLTKIKNFQTSECEVIGFVEQMTNLNIAQRDELGHTKRSHAKAGKKPAGTLGALEVRDIHTGVEFEIGTGEGLTLELRKKIWNNRAAYMHTIWSYQYQAVGVKDRPRCPSLRGQRDQRDM